MRLDVTPANAIMTLALSIIITILYSHRFETGASVKALCTLRATGETTWGERGGLKSTPSNIT